MLHFNVIIMLKYNMKEKVLGLKVFVWNARPWIYLYPFPNGISVKSACYCRVPTVE